MWSDRKPQEFWKRLGLVREGFKEEAALNGSLEENVKIWISRKEELNIPFGGGALVRMK